MTLNEAIKILTALISTVDTTNPRRTRPAVQLSIEALKHIISGRNRGYEWVDIQLPGETKEP